MTSAWPPRSESHASPDIHQNWSLCTPDTGQVILSYDTAKHQLTNDIIPAITTVLACCGLLTNGLFVVVSFVGLRSKSLPFRGYSLLLNRSIADLLVAFITVLFLSLHGYRKYEWEAPPSHASNKSENVTYSAIQYFIPNGRTLFTLLLTIDYWAVVGAYGVIALLPFLAVRYPWFYRSNVTDRRTVIAMIVIWLLGGLYSLTVVLLSSNNAFNAFNTEADLTRWQVTQEDFAFSISNLFIVTMALILVTYCYVSTILLLYSKNAFSGNAMHITSIRRMVLNNVAFAASCAVVISFVSVPLFLTHQINDLSALSQISFCATAVRAYQLGYGMSVWTVVGMSCWMLRIALDPTITFILDDRFKRVLNRKFINPYWTRRNTYTPAVIAPMTLNYIARSEFLQKCANLNVVPSSMSHPSGHYFRYRARTERLDYGTRKKFNHSNHIRFDDLMNSVSATGLH